MRQTIDELRGLCVEHYPKRVWEVFWSRDVNTLHFIGWGKNEAIRAAIKKKYLTQKNAQDILMDEINWLKRTYKE